MNHPFRRKRKKTEEAPPPSPLCTWTDEDQAYVDKMLWKEATRNFKKMMDNRPEKEPTPKSEHHFPELDNMITELEIRTGNKKGLISPIRNCRKCYFAIAVRSIGLNWFVKCSNVAKSHNHAPGHFWILAKSNLPCWRSPE